MRLSDIEEKTKFQIILLVCLGLYTAHFATILKYAVNIPFWDEWEAVAPNGIISNPTLSQIFAQHNEHRIVTTKVLTFLLYKIDGWNIITHLTLNYIIYGLLIFLLIRLIEKYVPMLPTWVLLSFTVFLFSTVNWENHFWAFQSTFHFSLLFLLVSVYFLFNEKQSWKNTLFGVFFSWLTVYSIAGGLVEILVTLIAYACFKLLRIRQGENPQFELRQLIITSILIGGSIGLYFVGYIKPSHHPPLVMPYRKEFWFYFLNLLSGGFGYQIIKLTPGFMVLFLVLVPVIGEFWRRRFKLSCSSWMITVLTLSIVGSLCSITMGRAGFEIGQSKASRYAEVVGVLIPLSVAMWTIFLNDRRKLLNYLLLAYWFFCLISFAKNWDLAKPYETAAQARQLGAQCVSNFYHNGGDGNCPMIYPAPIADRLDFDRTLRLSFVQENTK